MSIAPTIYAIIEHTGFLHKREFPKAMSRFYHKWVSTVLIAAILATLVVIPERQAFADDRPDVEIVALLVESGMLSSTEVINVREDLKNEFSGDMQSISLAQRVRRYADDIQQKLTMSKVLIVPVSPDEEPWKVQESLAKLYVEGDGTTSAKTKLAGVVLIGSVPLPLVTKDGRSYISMYPYTDFEDPVFVYDFSRQEFVPRSTEGRSQPEVWHGVIPYPVSWEQFIREKSRESELSKIRRENGVDAYTNRLNELRTEYEKMSREELAHYFDKNHSFYADGAYSKFSKKAVIMDFFREFRAVSSFALSGYQAYLDNWDNKSYMRYTYEWLQKLQDSYFTEANAAVVQDYGTNPDGSQKTVEQAITEAKKAIEDNDQLTVAEKERQKRLTEDNIRQGERLNAALSTSTSAQVPDIFTRDPIESFLHTATEVFGTVVGDQVQSFVNTGRWSMVGASGDREGYTMYKLVEALDETARKQILEVNTALEDELDTMLNEAATKSFHMQVDLPAAPINYFGRYTSFLYSTPKDGIFNYGDYFNLAFQQTKYTPGHSFAIDVSPTPPLNINIVYRPDNVEFLQTVEKSSSTKKYIPYTGQKYTNIEHHVSPDKYDDFYKMQTCSQDPKGNTQQQEACSSILFDNPAPLQAKYLELRDPALTNSEGDRREVLRYERTVKLKEYVAQTTKPDENYIFKELLEIGDNTLINDFSFFLMNKPLVWSTFKARLEKHETYLYDWNKQKIEFQVVLHVIDIPFSAQQCTIYIGGSPELSGTGENSYPLYLRGQSNVTTEEREANTLSVPSEANKNSTNLQNTASWRQEKVQEQVVLSLSSQERAIRAKEMEIAYVQANPPRGEDEDGSRRKAWEERLRKLKQERDDMIRVKDYAKSYFTGIWSAYYGVTEGDFGRFGEYLSHVGTLGEQAELAKLVEANRLYNMSQDATFRDVIKDGDILKEIDPATSIDPSWFGYDEDILRNELKRPASMSFPDWGDGFRNGYFGGCSAGNLRRVKDTATSLPFASARGEMQAIFDKVRSTHVEKLQSEDKGILNVLRFIQPLVGIGVAFQEFASSQEYFKTVTLYNADLFRVLLDKMLMDDSYQPSPESRDPIEASVVSFKRVLTFERDTLLGDMSEEDYDAIKGDLRAILRRGSEKIIEIEKLYQQAQAEKSAKVFPVNPADFGVSAPAAQLSISDRTSRDQAREAIYDLVQAEYDVRLLKTGKIRSVSMQSLNSFAAKALQSVSAVTAAIDGEFTSILLSGSIAEALSFVGITCDPQRALEPIFDPAGAKTLDDPGYIPLRTADNTVRIQEANTLAPTIVSGSESWEIPGQSLLVNPKLRDGYTPPGLPVASEAERAPNWKEPVLEEVRAQYPAGDPAPAATQIYRDDYPRTRDEVLYEGDELANSYEQGWEYTRKGYNITLDQTDGSEKLINEGLAPETSYLACLRYAKFGIEPMIREEATPELGKAQDSDAAKAPYYGNQFARDANGRPTEQPLEKRTVDDSDAEAVASGDRRPSAWQVIKNLIETGTSEGFEFDQETPDDQKTAPALEGVFTQFLREFQRRVEGEAGDFDTYPRPEDQLLVESRLPLRQYFGKWDYQFDAFLQLPNALETFFQKGLRGSNGVTDATDYNDPEKRRELYSIYGVRRIATVIPHKEPTNETIARQLRSMSASSLPVNNPRYVDFYLYEPVPQFNKFGEVEKWKEYEEHISIPYMNLFRAFPDDTRFSYAMESDRSQFKTDLQTVENRLEGIVSGMNNYLVDYLAKTSLSGPAASIDANSLRLNTSTIQNEKVRNTVENIMNTVASGLAAGAKSPQELQQMLQGGNLRETSSLKRTELEGVNFDTARFDKVIRTTSLATGESDAEKTNSAKKELAFAVYWQHLTLAEKYKFVMHNYLTSVPDPEVTRMSFWDEGKIGFEAGTVILESETASKAQLPLETLQGGRTDGALSSPQISLAPVTISEKVTRCDEVYRDAGGDKYGVPIQGWGAAISCWATNLWPLEDVSNAENDVNLQAWGDQTINQGKRFAEDTGRFFEGVGQTGELLVNTAGAAVSAVGSGLMAAGLWLQDTDQDGLSSLFNPTDTNGFNADVENTLEQQVPNGFRDGQDRVKKLIMYSGASSLVVSGSQIVVPTNAQEGVIPFGSGNPLEVHVALADKDGYPLVANNFDFVRLSILAEDAASSVVTLPAGEELKKVENGVATFRLFAKNSSKSFGKTRVVATLVRQKLPNAALAPEPVADVVGEFTVSVTPEVLGGLLTRLPCTAQERAAGTCARGDVREAQVDSIFSTNETAHQLSLVVVDMSQKNTLVTRNGKVSVVYYKDGQEKENLYTKAMGGRESLEVTLQGGTYAAVYAIPKESGKYYVQIIPEPSLGLAPTTLSFLVVDTTYSTMRLEVTPPVAVEGQTVTLQPKFTNLAGEEITLGLGQASIGIPRNTPYPLDFEALNARDSLPGGDTDAHYSIDITAGKADPLSLAIPDSDGVQTDPYTLDLRLSRIAPLSQLTEQAGSDAEAEAQRLLVRTPLLVYPKGTLQIRSTLVDGSTSLTLPAITDQDQECRISPETNAARQFSVQVELRDQDGRLVPYDGTLLTETSDTSLFTDVPATVTMRGGQGTILVTPSRKSGTTTLSFTDADESFARSSITLTLTSGPLAALRFTTQNIRPLEAAAEKNSTPIEDTMQPLRYVGLDVCGNPVSSTDTTTIALDLQPPRADGTLVDLLPLGVDGDDQLAQTMVTTGTNERLLQTQTLTDGRNGVVMQAVNFRGEASLTIRALTKDASGKTVINERILSDTAVVPIRMTLRKELIQSLEPNILYTNLLGGPYGDVTQKDFLGGWWMLTGKTQVVTTSTVAAEAPTNLAKVLPNGALDIAARTAPGLNVQMFAEPELTPNMPFTVNVKDRSDGVTVMQVRYNIIPFISGAVFESYAQDIPVDQSASLAPGIYIVPDTGVTTRKDLLAKNRSVVRFLTTDTKGVLQEEAILADNLQFFPGGGSTDMPKVVMNTDRRDLLVLRLESASNKPLATVYVKLDEQRVFPSDGDYARDVQLSLDALRSSAVETGSISIDNGKLTLSDQVTTTLAEAERLAPTLVGGARAGLRYIRTNLGASDILTSAQAGIFAKPVEGSLMRFVAEGENVGLYIGDRLLLPLRNLPQKIATVQEWLGTNTLQYQLSITGGTSRVQAQFASNDGARKSIATIIPVYGAAPLLWNTLSNNTPKLMGWYQTSTQNAPYTYTRGETGLVVRAKRVEDIPGNTTARSLPQCTTSGQSDIVVAGILPTGEAWSCFEAILWEKDLMIKDGFSQLSYLLRENAGTSSRILTEVFMHFGADRAFPAYEMTSATRNLLSDAHQGAYVEIKNSGYIWNAQAGKIVRRDPLEAGGAGFLPVFSLLPGDFAQVPTQMLALGRFRTTVDNATKYPTIALEEQINGTWTVVATVTLQFQETPLEVRAIAKVNAAAELPNAGANALRLFLGNTNISLREEGTKVRIFNGTQEAMRFETKPFRLEAIASGLRPELLDIVHDRFQMRLLDGDGAELVLLDLQRDSRYSSVQKLEPGTSLPQSLLSVPGVYIEEGAPVLQMLHSRDRTMSRITFGFEEVLTINKTGGIRVTRPDLVSSVYAPNETSGQFMQFAVKFLGLDAMKLSLSIAKLPFDLRVLTYLQDNQRPTFETREVPTGGSIIRPALSRVSTGFLKMVGPFLDLRDVSKSLSDRNSELQKTTLSMPVSLTDTGFFQASVLMNEKGTDQSKVALRSVFVPKQAPTDVRLQTPAQAQSESIAGLAITVQNTDQQGACVRNDTLTVGGSTRVLITCRDMEGVLIREGDTPIARIRHDGTFRVFDSGFSIQTRLRTDASPKISYSLASAAGETLYLSDIVTGSSPELSAHVRRGAPDVTRSAPAGTYVSYIAQSSDSKAGYPFMESLAGVNQSENTLLYCTDTTRPAATCQPQLSFAPESFLAKSSDQFAWEQEVELKDADGFTFPAFGYAYTPSAKRIATIVLLLKDTHLRTGANIELLPEDNLGVTVENTATSVALRRNGQSLLSVNTITGAVSTSLATLEANMWTPEEIRLRLTQGTEFLGELRLKGTFTASPVISAQRAPNIGAKAGMYVFDIQNTLQVLHDFPAQSTRVMLGYDTLVTLAHNGDVTLGIPSMLRTVVPNGAENPLRFKLNLSNESLDIGDSLVAFPLSTIAQKLRDAQTVVQNSALQTAPFMRTAVDTFGNLVTEAGLARASSGEKQQNLQTRPVYAPTKPQVIFAPNAGTLRNPSLPTFQLNPTGFFNAVRNEAYSVVEKEGNIYFTARSANPYWTSILGSDPACTEELRNGGVAGAILADGSRVVCDPFHAIDIRFDASAQHFIYTLRTLQTREGVSSVIGTVAMHPGDMQRMRVLTQVNTFDSRDIAQNFAYQGLYGAISEDYSFDDTSLELRLAKGDQAKVFSALGGSLMQILTNMKVWNGTQDRFYYTFDAEAQSTPSFTQRRVPLSWKVYERREVQFTEEGSIPWNGDVLAATLRLTLSDPVVATSIGTVTGDQNVPSFVCTPLNTSVSCAVDNAGKVRVTQSTEVATPPAEQNVSQIPALVFLKDTAAKWAETGLWNGTITVRSGEGSGIARLEMYNQSGEVQAVIQYRPAMQYARPRLVLVQPNANAPVLSTTSPEVQVLLARPGVRVIEKDAFFVLSIEEEFVPQETFITALGLRGSIAQLGLRLQNADVLSYDGEAVQSIASIGQFGLGILKDPTGMRWTIGDASALQRAPNTWILRNFNESTSSPAPVLARGQGMVESLNASTVIDQADAMVTIRDSSPTNEVLATLSANSGEVELRSSTLLKKSQQTQDVVETYITEQRPLGSLVRIAVHPQTSLSSGTVPSQVSELTLVAANTQPPTLDDPGTAFIQPLQETARLRETEQAIVVEELRSGNWSPVATIDRASLQVELQNSEGPFLTWERRSNSLLEVYIQDTSKDALARVRQQNTMPDLTKNAYLLADFPRQASTEAVISTLADSAPRTISRGATGNILLFGGRLSATSTDGGVRLGTTNANDRAAFTDLTRQEKTREVLEMTPDRLLVSSFDQNAYQIVPETLLPHLLEYMVYPAESAMPDDALLRISRSQPMSERYATVTDREGSASLTAVAKPGLVITENRSPVTLSLVGDTQETVVRYGYDTVGSIGTGGNITFLAPAWEALVTTAKNLRSQAVGVIIEFLGEQYLQYMSRLHPETYENTGVRNTMFVEMVSAVGGVPLSLTLGADRPSSLTLGQDILRWNEEMVQSILAQGTTYVYESSETALLKFTLQVATRSVASLFIQTVADISNADTEDQSTNTDAENIGDLPVDQVTNTLEVLGGTGIYVQIKAPEKGALSLAYEPYGDSTNNLYAVALRDASMPLAMQNQINPETTGVEDVLEVDGEGFGYKGEFKNMLLFAGGNTVGESTLPYMSEVLINIGDPVIHLKIEESDRDNESFTSDIGELVYTHRTGQIQQMVLYDIDKDGRKDIVFTDGDGELQVVRNAGGRPVQWKYIGTTFEIPEGVRELLVRQVNSQDELAITLGSPTAAATREVKEGVTSVTAMDASFVELKNKGDALLERCKTRIPDIGKIESSQFGDIDGDGTDDMVVITTKNEIKTIRIDNTIDCDTQNPAQQRYTVTTVDTIGMKLDGIPLTAPVGNVPQGYNLLPVGDVYARFNGVFTRTWDPTKSVCPEVDPRSATPVYPQSQVPTTMPANPEMVFIQEPVNQNSTPSGGDPLSAALAEAQKRFEGSEGVYFSYEGGERLMRMFLAADLPYIRSGGQSLTRYGSAFQSLAKNNPFSCIAGNYGGIGSFINGVSSIVSGATSVMTGPMKAIAMTQEATSAENPATTLYTRKYAKDINGGIIQAGDSIAYVITMTNNLGVTKNIDLADRFQQGTDLLRGSLICQIGTQRFSCSAQDSGNLFGLYVPNIEIPAGQTLTVSYQAQVRTSPIPLSLQLMDFDRVKEMLDQNLFTSTVQQNALRDAINAGVNRLQKFISVSTPSMAQRGSFVYWRNPDSSFSADILKPPAKPHPILQIPVIGPLLESLGLIWNDDGTIAQGAASGDANDASKSTQKLNNILLNAFMAADRDLDGLIDLWDEDIAASPLGTSSIPLISDTPGGIQLLRDSATDAQKMLQDVGSKFDKSLDAVAASIASNDCQTAGCGLVPSYMNTAFFAPRYGSNVDVNAMLSDASVGGIIGEAAKKALNVAADAVDWPVFAAPMATPPWFWPAIPIKEDMQLTSQFRLYFTVTLSGRFALTACGGPYHLGMIDLPVPTGLEFNKNCFSYVLPDLLNIQKLCQDIADGLSGVFAGLGRTVSSGGYTVARMVKAGNVTGFAENEANAPFTADQFVFETEKFKDPTANKDPSAIGTLDNVGKGISSFLKDFRQLGRGLSTAIPVNSRTPGFPAFIVDWVERQVHEVLAKLLKLPTITLILPDPTLGFTRPIDPDLQETTYEERLATCSDEAAARGEECSLTIMDGIRQKAGSLSSALERGETQAEQRKRQEASQEKKQLQDTCNKLGGQEVCSSEEELSKEIARLDAATALNLPVLPMDDAGLPSQQAITQANQALVDSLEEGRKKLALLPPSEEKTALSARLTQIENATFNDMDAQVVTLLTDTRLLFNDISKAANPETYQNAQLRSYVQLKESQQQRAELAACNASDPIACSMRNAEQTYSQFINGVDLDSGASIADTTGLFNIGASSDQLLRKEVPGFSEILGIVGSLPFVSIRMRDVVFYYPWLPPDRISETLYNLEGVKNQSLSSFHNFYKPALACFYETDAAGNVDWNPMLPPTFTIRSTLQSNATSDANTAASNGVTMEYCLAAARVGQDAWAGLQGIENNINRIKQYGDIMNSLKQYIQWKTYIVGRLLNLVTGIVGQISSYVRDQNRILISWRDTIRSISNAIASFQVIVDIFGDYQSQCTGCANQRGTVAASVMDLLGNFIQLDVVAFPKWPDVEIDLSQINLRYDVVIPNIRLVPREFTLPRMTPILMPSLAGLPKAQLDLYASQGLNFSIPVLPALPLLPLLPELPPFRFPKLPDLPPPPKIPQLNAQVRLMVQTIAKIINIICLVQRNVLPIAEGRVRSHLEAITASNVLWRGKTATTPVYEPTLDVVRLSTQVNLRMDSNSPFGQDTYMFIFDEAARWWNQQMGSLISSINTAVGDIPSKLFGTAANFVNQEVLGKSVNAVNQFVAQSGQTLQASLNEQVSIPVRDFQAAVQEAVIQQKGAIRVSDESAATDMGDLKAQREVLATATENDPATMYLVDQLIGLQESLISSTAEAGLSDPASFIPDLEAQIAFLASDEAGLPKDIQETAVNRLQGIVDRAKQPALSPVQDADISSLPYIQGWKQLETELANEQELLEGAEVDAARLTEATTFEEFQSALSDLGLLGEEEFMDRPVASIEMQDSQNTDAQRLLETLSTEIAREVPMDVRDISTKKSIVRVTKQPSQVAVTGATGKPVASNVDITGAARALPVLAQTSSVVTAPAVTQAPVPVREARDNEVALGTEEEGAILVQLPKNGGLITLTNYTPPAGLPVQVAMADLSGRPDYPDIVYTVGSDIFVKYNQYNRSANLPELYMGADRIREVTSIDSIMPALPAVMSPKVLNVENTSITVSFDLPSRTRTLDSTGSLTGEEARYLLNVYSKPLGRELGESPTQFVILPVDAIALSANSVALTALIQKNEAILPPAVRDSLAKEALKQGLPAHRVLLGAVNGSNVQVTMPIINRNAPMFMTIVPRVETEDGEKKGLASEQIFAHPQIGLDTTPPMVQVTGGESQIVPLESPFVLNATAEDGTNDVVDIWWDTDLLVDSDLDGDTANDRNVFCAPETPCTVPLSTMSQGSMAQVPALNAPTVTKTWQTGDRGLHTFKLFARDAIGNTTSREVRVDVQPTEIRIDEFDEVSGTLRGSLYPVQPNKTLQLLRVRDQEVSTLSTPLEIVTDGAGRFTIEGLLPGEGTALYDAAGNVIEE